MQTKRYELSTILGVVGHNVATSCEDAKDGFARAFGFADYAEALAAEPDMWSDLDAATY